MLGDQVPGEGEGRQGWPRGAAAERLGLSCGEVVTLRAWAVALPGLGDNGLRSYGEDTEPCASAPAQPHQDFPGPPTGQHQGSPRLLS